MLKFILKSFVNLLIFFIFLFLILVIIGIFFKKKEYSFKNELNINHTKESLNFNTTSLNFNTTSNLINKDFENNFDFNNDLIFYNTSSIENEKINNENSFILNLENQIDIKINEKMKNLKPNNTKNILNYLKEIYQISLKFKDIKLENLNSTIIFDLANSLYNIEPPSSLFSFHIDLLKKMYKIGYLLEELEKTDDINKQKLIYNLINKEFSSINFER
jgi:hypothetical protein